MRSQPISFKKWLYVISCHKGSSVNWSLHGVHVSSKRSTQKLLKNNKQKACLGDISYISYIIQECILLENK